jgi:hypothetical protein
MTPAELVKHSQAEIDRWAPVIQRIVAAQKK